MGLSTFIGGVHPYEGKELSSDKPIQVIQPKGELVFPLSQHIGAPAKPLVAKGDTVLAGQKIAEAGGFISANVICSVSGTVKGIEPRLMANGSMVQSIIVENDGEYRTVEGFGQKRDYTALSKQEIRDIVKEAGIVGLGGAGFPTNVKLAPKNEEEIDYVIVNGAECEPYLTSDYRVMLEQPEKVVGGLKVILQLFDKAKGVIGIEENKPEAIRILSELVKDEPRIQVCTLKTKYPQGGERFLIYAVTGGREINSTMLPADAGCIVDNIDTVVSIYNAVCETTPLIRRIITVTGDAIREPRNFEVRLGTNYQELIEAAGGFKEEPEKVLSGGPMMGVAQADLAVPVVKGTNAVLCLSRAQDREGAHPQCIRCAKCVTACPMSLQPLYLYRFEQAGDLTALRRLNLIDCIECGCCAYVCPGRLPLVESFRAGKRAVKEENAS